MNLRGLISAQSAVRQDTLRGIILSVNLESQTATVKVKKPNFSSAEDTRGQAIVTRPTAPGDVVVSISRLEGFGPADTITINPGMGNEVVRTVVSVDAVNKQLTLDSPLPYFYTTNTLVLSDRNSDKYVGSPYIDDSGAFKTVLNHEYFEDLILEGVPMQQNGGSYAYALPGSPVLLGLAGGNRYELSIVGPAMTLSEPTSPPDPGVVSLATKDVVLTSYTILDADGNPRPTPTPNDTPPGLFPEFLREAQALIGGETITLNFKVVGFDPSLDWGRIHWRFYASGDKEGRFSAITPQTIVVNEPTVDNNPLLYTIRDLTDGGKVPIVATGETASVTFKHNNQGNSSAFIFAHVGLARPGEDGLQESDYLIDELDALIKIPVTFDETPSLPRNLHTRAVNVGGNPVKTIDLFPDPDPSHGTVSTLNVPIYHWIQEGNRYSEAPTAQRFSSYRIWMKKTVGADPDVNTDFNNAWIHQDPSSVGSWDVNLLNTLNSTHDIHNVFGHTVTITISNPANPVEATFSITAPDALFSSGTYMKIQGIQKYRQNGDPNKYYYETDLMTIFFKTPNT